MSNALPQKWQVPIDAGFTVFALTKGKKTPAGPWKRWQNECPSLEQLQQWAANDTNIGIVMGKQSNCFALDIDSEAAHQTALEKGLPETVCSKTPRGWHYLFKLPETPVKNGVNLFEGADIRGDGGYIVGACSFYDPSPAESADGKVAGGYSWINSPADCPVAPAPEWLLLEIKGEDLLTTANTIDTPLPPFMDCKNSPYGQAALCSELDSLILSIEGTRNDNLNKAAFSMGQLAAMGHVDESGAKQALADIARAMGLNEPEIHDTIESGWTSGKMSPRAANDNPPPWPPQPPQSNAALPLIWMDDIEANLDQQWLVENWLPTQGLGVVFGHPASGKSFLALDMAMAIASGQPWGTYETAQGPVIYLVAEGATGFKQRIAALKQERDIATGTPFAMIPSAIDLQSPAGDIDRFIDAIESAKTHLGQNPAMVVIDTLSRTFGGADENSSVMAAYVNNCTKIADRFNCFVAVVHHMPKDREATGMRGHSSLPAACDTTIRVERTNRGRFAQIAKQKDGPDDLRIAFELQQVTIGHDSKGEPVTTCVMAVKGIDKRPQISERQRTIGKLGKNAKAVWDALPALIASHGVEGDAVGEAILPRKIDSKAHRDALQDALGKVSQGKPESLPRTLRTVIAQLNEKRLICLSNEWLWITEENPVKSAE